MAFTLVEVMISVALVLILIIGINQAFKAVTDTVGAGQTLSAITRDNRAIQPVLYNDLRGMVIQNSPAFIIAASRVSAFRNRADETGDKDALPLTIDLNSNNTEGEAAAVSPGEIIHPATYNSRSHRTDRLAFFARDTFRRQTGNPGQFSSTLTGGEAWIWYGHLRLQNQAPAPLAFPVPGEGTFATNQNNLHAANFALGRMVMLLRAEDAAGDIYDSATPAVAQNHIDQVGGPGGLLSPLAYGSPSVPAFTQVQASRYDLAAATIDEYYADVLAACGQPYAVPPLAGSNADDWWQRLLYAAPFAVPGPAPLSTSDYRFFANRFFAKPLDADKAARVAPILASGCAQFLVEFAGDYLTQTQEPGAATDGTILSTEPDGVTDFIMDNYNGAFERRTRWYGMPRDVAGSIATNAAGDVIGGPDGTIPLAGTGANMAGPDVLPLRDVRAAALAAFVPPAGYASPERNITDELPPPGGADYLSVGGMLPTARYTCVWGPDVDLAHDPLPRMLRITIVLDEPAGRLADGQTYEYVIDLP